MSEVVVDFLGWVAVAFYIVAVCAAIIKVIHWLKEIDK